MFLQRFFIHLICQRTIRLCKANKVNKTAPREFEIPFTGGFVMQAGCCYRKTQEGIVSMSFRAGKNGEEIAAGDHLIAIMPEGYRPTIVAHSTIVSWPQVTTTGLLWVAHTGEVRVRVSASIPAGVSVSICGEISYVAAQ